LFPFYFAPIREDPGGHLHCFLPPISHSVLNPSIGFCGRFLCAPRLFVFSFIRIAIFSPDLLVGHSSSGEPPPQPAANFPYISGWLLFKNRRTRLFSLWVFFCGTPRRTRTPIPLWNVSCGLCSAFPLCTKFSNHRISLVLVGLLGLLSPSLRPIFLHQNLPRSSSVIFFFSLGRVPVRMIVAAWRHRYKPPVEPNPSMDRGELCLSDGLDTAPPQRCLPYLDVFALVKDMFKVSPPLYRLADPLFRPVRPLFLRFVKFSTFPVASSFHLVR